MGKDMWTVRVDERFWQSFVYEVCAREQASLLEAQGREGVTVEEQ